MTSPETTPQRLVVGPDGQPLQSTTRAGFALLKRFEGVRLKAYRCAAGVLTIGYGHTGAIPAHVSRTFKLPDAVTEGLEISAEAADALLEYDIARFERCVREAVQAPLGTNQFDALVSLAFNIGERAFRASTIVRLLNAASVDYDTAADEFVKWRKAGGRVIPALERRRAVERSLFLTGRYDPTPYDASDDDIDLIPPAAAPDRPVTEPREALSPKSSRTIDAARKGIAGDVVQVMTAISLILAGARELRDQTADVFAGINPVLAAGLLVAAVAIYGLRQHWRVIEARVDDFLAGRR